MGKRNIKGITVEIDGDTLGLQDALKKVNKTIGETETQLRDVNKLLKLDPGNTELLKQKQQLLGAEISATTRKLEQLTEAEKQLNNQGVDKHGDQYQALRREIIETNQSLEKLTVEAKKTSKQMWGIEDEPLKDVSKAADDAANSLDKAGKEVSNFKDHLKADVIIEGAKGITSAVIEAAEETKEYQKIMASLEVSSAQAGYTAEQTKEIYRTLFGVLGDDQTAATTTANLQALKISQEDLTKMTNIAIGAWATYGDSIPIDGLAESINETAKTATVTGNLADVLNWAGVSEEEFNKKLEGMGSNSERVNEILKQLSSQGLEAAGQAWRNNNQALVESNEASAEFQAAMAQLSEKIMPILTEITRMFTIVVEKFNVLPEKTQNIILVIGALSLILGPLISTVGGVVNGVKGLIGAFGSLGGAVGTTGGILGNLGSLFSGLWGIISAHPVVAVVTTIIGGITLLWNKCEWFRDVVTGVFESLKEKLGGIVDGIAIFFTQKIPNAFTIAKTAISDTTDKIKTSVSDAFQRTKAMVSDTVEKIKNSAVNGFENMVDGIKGAVGKVTNVVKEGFSGAVEFITSLPSKALDWGKDIVGGIADGIKGAIGKVTGAVSSVASGIRSLLHFSEPDEGPLSDFHTYMPDMMKGMAKGIKDNVWRVTDEIRSVAQKMKETIQETGNTNMLTRENAVLYMNQSIYLGNEKLEERMASGVVKRISSREISRLKARGKHV